MSLRNLVKTVFTESADERLIGLSTVVTFFTIASFLALVGAAAAGQSIKLTVLPDYLVSLYAMTVLLSYVYAVGIDVYKSIKGLPTVPERPAKQSE